MFNEHVLESTCGIVRESHTMHIAHLSWQLARLTPRPSHFSHIYIRDACVDAKKEEKEREIKRLLQRLCVYLVLLFFKVAGLVCCY